VAGVRGTDLLQDAADVGGGDHAVVGSEQHHELVADRSLQVAEDLRPVRIVLQARGGSVEVSRKPVVGVLLEPVLPGVPTQANDDPGPFHRSRSDPAETAPFSSRG
jgi:hypothetical protein